MPPSIALIIFMIFIFVGYYLDTKESKNVTRATWLPLLWMVICGSRSINQWLNFSTSSYLTDADSATANLGGSVIDQVGLSLTILLSIYVIHNRKSRVVGIFSDNKALTVFIIYLGLTVLWSDIFEASLRRWVRLAGHFIVSSVLMTEPEPLESVKSVFRRAAYLMIPLSVMFIKYFPQKGILFTRMGDMIWTGVALMKNGLGHLSFVITFFIVWDTIEVLARKDKIYVPRVLYNCIVFLMALWLLRGPGDVSYATSIACLILGFTILIGSLLSVIKARFHKIGAIIVTAVLLFIVLEYSLGITEIIVTSLGRNMTFTDRTPLWNALLDIGSKNLFFGYGYGGFWTMERVILIEKEAGGFAQGHNGYLEIFVEGGLVAIILLVVLIIKILKDIQRNGLSDYKYAVFRLCYFAMILLANVTESCFARERDLLTFVFFIITMNIPIRGKMFYPSQSDLKQGKNRI
jgi:exopolysaccharide production protein ExoQ